MTCRAKGPNAPERLQVVEALPRDAAGSVRTEILQLVAMNQLDLIEPLITSDADDALLPALSPDGRICATDLLSRRVSWRREFRHHPDPPNSCPKRFASGNDPRHPS